MRTYDLGKRSRAEMLTFGLTGKEKNAKKEGKAGVEENRKTQYVITYINCKI